MILTISIAQSELEKVAGLEDQLREISTVLDETDPVRRFVPHSGKLLEFINLLGRFGVVYGVVSNVRR